MTVGHAGGDWTRAIHRGQGESTVITLCKRGLAERAQQRRGGGSCRPGGQSCLWRSRVETELVLLARFVDSVHSERNARRAVCSIELGELLLHLCIVKHTHDAGGVFDPVERSSQPFGHVLVALVGHGRARHPLLPVATGAWVCGARVSSAHAAPVHSASASRHRRPLLSFPRRSHSSCRHWNWSVRQKLLEHSNYFVYRSGGTRMTFIICIAGDQIMARRRRRRPPGGHTTAAGSGGRRAPFSTDTATHTHTARSLACPLLTLSSARPFSNGIFRSDGAPLTHTRRMDGFCIQNADQLGSLAGLSFPAVYVGVVECATAFLPPASSSLTHTRRMDGFCNQNADQLGSLAGLSFPAVHVGVVDCAPASPYAYSSSTHRFPDERTHIEATPLSATSAELGLGLGMGLGLGSHSSSHAPSHAPLLLATLLSHNIPLTRVH